MWPAIRQALAARRVAMAATAAVAVATEGEAPRRPAAGDYHRDVVDGTVRAVVAEVAAAAAAASVTLAAAASFGDEPAASPFEHISLAAAASGGGDDDDGLSVVALAAARPPRLDQCASRDDEAMPPANPDDGERDRAEPGGGGDRAHGGGAGDSAPSRVDASVQTYIRTMRNLDDARAAVAAHNPASNEPPGESPH